MTGSTIRWEERDLGVLSWDPKIEAYVLRRPRASDLPLSFNVYTMVGFTEQAS